MFPLDSKTIERIARVVCDLGGPFERRGAELERLLYNSGWADPPEYDGSPRIPWLIEALTARATERADMERFLCRICDPLEYEGGKTEAEQMRTAINRILEPEMLVVSYAGNRPVMGEIQAGNFGPVFVDIDDLQRRLQRLVQDKGAVELLISRARETRLCEESGAYGLAVVGVGSLVESVLYHVLIERDPDLREHGFRDQKGKRDDRPTLERLINTAHAKGWIQVDAKQFMDIVRDYRNLVHLRHQRKLELSPDRDTVMLCWAPVQAVMNDLDRQFPDG